MTHLRDRRRGAIEIINSSEYRLSVGILTANPFAAFELADGIRSGAVRATKASGTGGHFGSSANLDTFCDLQWVTMQSDIERYPF